MAEPPKTPTPPNDPRQDPGRDPSRDPRRDPIYRAILAVLTVSVIVGALLALSAESLFGSRALANAGLGMALLCFVLYWVFRLLGRRAARRGHGPDSGRE